MWLSLEFIFTIEGNIEAVIQHLADGDDVNSRDVDGRTPLHNTSAKGYVKLAELLINKGANLNAASKNGITPLHNVVRYDQKVFGEFLIEKGVNVNV